LEFARTVAPLLLVFSGCVSEKDSAESCGIDGARLRTAQLVVDAGTVAVNERETVTVYLANYGEEPLTVYGLSLEDDSGAWTVVDGWATTTATDASGAEVPAMVIDGGCADAPTFAAVDLSYRPTEDGFTRSTLNVISNDPGAAEHDATTGLATWSLTLRGDAVYACGFITPICVDFGEQAPGSSAAEEVEVYNCGAVTLVLSNLEWDGSAGFYSEALLPFYVLPGGDEHLTINWIADTGSAEEASLSVVSNAPTLDDDVQLYGNTGVEACGVDEDGDGFSADQGDCDDADASVYPAASESYDTIDNDCDGDIDEGTYSFDDDRDGFSEVNADGTGGDCDDADPWVYPGAIEDCDDADNDCDGATDEGDDGVDGSACAALTEGVATP